MEMLFKKYFPQNKWSLREQQLCLWIFLSFLFSTYGCLCCTCLECLIDYYKYALRKPFFLCGNVYYKWYFSHILKVQMMCFAMNNPFLAQVTEMEGILQEHHNLMPAREVLVALAEKFRFAFRFLLKTSDVGLVLILAWGLKSWGSCIWL